MPPVLAPRWVVCTRVCFLTRFTPSTMTLPSFGKALMTFPRAPLSLPAMTTTVSPFLILISEHLRGQADDLHEALVTQLPPDRAEDAGAARVAAVLDDHGSVLVEPDVRTVRAPPLLGGPDDDRLDDVALLHA